jgi:hypothetical protein
MCAPRADRTAIVTDAPPPGPAPAPPLDGLEPAGEFRSFSDWVNTARRRIGGLHAVCFDAKGRLCAWGAHFMRARDEGAFPVRFWVPDGWERLVRPTEERFADE